jgi:hypothetical protein
VVPGDTVTLRGGPWDGELCLSEHVVLRDDVSLSIFDFERRLRHQYDATGIARKTSGGWREEFRFCGTFACPETAHAALEDLSALVMLR